MVTANRERHLSAAELVERRRPQRLCRHRKPDLEAQVRPKRAMNIAGGKSVRNGSTTFLLIPAATAAARRNVDNVLNVPTKCEMHVRCRPHTLPLALTHCA